MRYCCFALLVAGLISLTAASAYPQNPQSFAAAVPLRFESWEAPLLAPGSNKRTIDRFIVAPQNRTRRALIGGAVGAAAGVVVCTAVSTLANDSAEGGLSFCPLDSYLLIGGAGFVLGAAVGWVT